MPQISTIILTYKRPVFLKEAIDCILSQSFQDFEIIVVDNANQKEAKDIVFSFNDKRIRYFPQKKNLMVSGGRNAGLKKVKSKYVFFLDDDDLIRKDGLEKLILAIKESNNCEVAGSVSAAALLYDELGKEKHIGKFPDIKPTLAKYLWEVPMGYLGLIDKKAFDEIGWFDENLQSSEDIDFYIRFLAKFKLAVIPDHLFYLRKHSGPRFTSFDFKVKPEVAENLLKVIRKNNAFLKNYPPKIYSQILRATGINFLRAGKMNKSRKLLIKSIYYNPFHLKTYAVLILSLLGYGMLERIWYIKKNFKIIK